MLRLCNRRVIAMFTHCLAEATADRNLGSRPARRRQSLRRLLEGTVRKDGRRGTTWGGWTTTEPLRENLVNYFAVHIGEAAVGAVVVESQLRVLDAEQMENRGVEVVDRHWILH